MNKGKPMKKDRHTSSRLLALLLCLPIALCEAFSMMAMAQGEIIDVETYNGVVILENPALIGDVEDDMGDVAGDPTNSPQTETPTQTPTEAPTQSPTETPADVPTQAPTDPPVVSASYEIIMDAPSGWYLNRAAMEVTVKDIGKTGWTNIKMIIAGKTLIDGALPSGHLWLDVLDNCTVEVIVTDPSGKEHKKSVTVSCFDKERPILKASVKGEYLNIEATDAHSGIASVQVNGTNYNTLTDGKLAIHLKGYADAYEQLLVQTVDKVGNVSKAIAVANPFFHNVPTTAPTNTPKPTNMPKPTNTRKPTRTPTTTKKPSDGSGSSGSSGSSSGSKATATPAVTETPVPIVTVVPSVMPTMFPTTIETGTPFSYGGNSFTRDLLYDQYTNKQFIAIETRNGDVFYMIIDYDKPLDDKGEKYETYFLNLVDSRDLLDVVDETDLPAEPEVIYVTPEPTALPTQAPVTTETKKENSGALLGMVAILALAGGGALWYFKFRKPDSKRKQEYDDDDEFEDDDEDEETVNEDE